MSNFQCKKCGVIHCDNGKDGYSLHQGELKTINTFEDLAYELKATPLYNYQLCVDGFYLAIGDCFWVEYFEDGWLSICDHRIEVAPQQAYNIITALKQNINNEPTKHLQKTVNNEEETKV